MVQMVAIDQNDVSTRSIIFAGSQMADHGGGLLQPSMHSRVPMPREGQHLACCCSMPSAVQEDVTRDPLSVALCMHGYKRDKDI